VDKQVPKHVMQYFEKIVDVPTVLQQEVPFEVLEVQVVETITEVPRPQYQTVPKEIAKFHVEVQERVEHIRGVIQEERAIAVDHVQYVDVITQVGKPVTEYVDKEVPRFETQAVEKVVEIPTFLDQEVIFEVPEVQVAEAVRQVPDEMRQQAVKEVPRFEMKYVNRVVEVESRLHQDGNAQRTVSPPRTSMVAGAAMYSAPFAREPAAAAVTYSAPTAFVATPPTPQRLTGQMTAPTQFVQAPAMSSSAVPGTLQVGGSSSSSTCTNCGNVFMPDANFCRKCGQPRQASELSGSGRMPLLQTVASEPGASFRMGQSFVGQLDAGYLPPARSWMQAGTAQASDHPGSGVFGQEFLPP